MTRVAPAAGPSPGKIRSARLAPDRGRGRRAEGSAGEGAVLLGIGTVLLAACCAHAQPIARPYPAPAPDALIAALSAQQAAARSMNARVRATSWLGGERVRATVNMLVERDGHLRFEAEVSLQGTVATLATDGAAFALYDAHKNELSRGPACPANVASLVRIPLAPAEVAAVLLGDARPPGPIDPATASVGWDSNRGADLLAVPVPAGGTLQVSFRGDGSARTLVAVDRIDARGAPLWRTSYEDHETEGGVRLPKTIRFAEGKGSFDDGVEIKFKDRALNAPAPAGAFTLQPPAGATVVEVGCGPAPK
jgi:outer membrane lipoprotein-sorting protein